jgi:hypothetical protein
MLTTPLMTKRLRSLTTPIFIVRTDEAAMDEGTYLWDHFKFNADQRLKAFNFFVILSTFANGGVFAAIETGFSPCILALLGLFVIVLSVVFWLVDARSKQLLQLTIPGMKKMENGFSESSRLFAIDTVKQGRFIRYTFAFRTLMLTQPLFGTGIAVYGVSHWSC